MLRRLLPALLIALTLLAATPAFAGKGCRTPDGYLFTGKGMGGTGLYDDKGMGGTGVDRGMGGTGIDKGMGGTGQKFTERKGIGGTGIDGDIGVFGRITAFGSICVNGLEIEYGNTTPVTDAGAKSSTKGLKIGQVVAARAYKDKNGDFRARRIAITQLAAGRVSDLTRSRMMVGKDAVIAAKGQNVFKGLKDGDYVSVSGLRRADGTIVAGHVEKTTSARHARNASPRDLFGRGVKYFSVQGYVRSAGKDGKVTLADGTVVRMSQSVKQGPQESQRVIIMGIVDNKGLFTAETIIPEVKAFVPAIEIPLIKQGLLGPDGVNLPLLAGGGAPGIEVPGVDVPAVDVPAVDVPTVDLPGLPPIDVPTVDVPPIDIPTLPPIQLPDLPLPGR
ncbi:MAG: DUF5666 domain-containing protein [Alphaproteobacteria bacterium]